MKWFRHTSLRARLFLICFLFVVPAFGVLFYGFYQERQYEIEEMKAEAIQSAALVASDEERRIRDTRSLLITLARSPIAREPDSAACREGAAHLLFLHPRYRNIGVTDRDGNVACSALPPAGRVNVADREYFRRAVETRDFSGGAYQVGRITKRPGINFAYPVTDDRDRLRGVVFAAMDIDDFGGIGKAIGGRLQKGATLTKLDASGMVLGRYPREAELTGKPFPDRGVVGPLLSKGGGQTVGRSHDGTTSIFAAAQIPKTFLEKDLFVVVSIPEAQALAELKAHFAREIAILATGIAVALCLVWIGSGIFIRRPVKSLLQATRKVAAGDAEVRMGPPYEKGEFGDLARDFDEMTGAIRARRAERERANEALLRSEENYRSIVKNSPLGIYRSTPDGRFLMVNPALVEMLGYDSEEELLRRNLDTDVYLHPGERQRILGEFVKRVEEGGVLVVDVDWKRKDGKVLHVRASGVAVRSADGSPRYYEVFVEDETERRALETQFLHSQRLEAIGRLAGGIAHDFNNLLSVIMGYSEILLGKRKEDEELRPQLEEIRQAAERAAHLTRQLLAFSRKQVLEPKMLNLNDVVFDTKKMLQRLIGEDIELHLNLSMDAGSVRIDPGQLEQVILNLVVNARDAMPEGGRLVIETHKVDLREPQHHLHGEAVMPAGSYSMLALTDTGSGMDEETLKRIFEPFFTTKEAGKGTGLGLSTVYGIVKQSGGYIWAYSEAGRGSVFRIYLPRIEGEAETPVVRAETGASPRGSETVLVVDDDEAIRNLVREFLVSCGYRVLAAGGFDEALEAAGAARGPIHLLVTDVIMRGKSGPALADRLTRDLPGIKVLYISGYSNDAVSVRGALKEGAFFLSKPFTRDLLARKVREVLDAG
jgi:PAS domain S-box-containing protein